MSASDFVSTGGSSARDACQHGRLASMGGLSTLSRPYELSGDLVSIMALSASTCQNRTLSARDACQHGMLVSAGAAYVRMPWDYQAVSASIDATPGAAHSSSGTRAVESVRVPENAPSTPNIRVPGISNISNSNLKTPAIPGCDPRIRPE